MTEHTRIVHVKDNVPGAIYIGRPVGRQKITGSPLGNPFKIGRDGWRREVLAKYQHHLLESPALIEHLLSLRPVPALSCWCRHEDERLTGNNTCHGDVLLRLLDQYTDDELRAMARVGEGTGGMQ